MSRTGDAFDRLGEGIFDLLSGFLTSRTTYIMALGFIAVYASSGKIEAFQQLLANLGLGALWVIKMATQNVVGIVKNGGAIKPGTVVAKPTAVEKVKDKVLPPVPPPVGQRVDWNEFTIQVDVEKQRLIRELKGDKKELFAKWEAVKNVGGRFIVSTIQDLNIYASTVLDAALSRFKEATGFGYDEIVGGRIPEKLAAKCGCSLIVPWSIQNNAYDDLLAVQNAIERSNSVAVIDSNDWRQNYNEWQCTLAYVYGTIASYRDAQGDPEPLPMIY